jgi:hypothetical protein
MFAARGSPDAREYLWFALLLIVVLATSAAHLTGSARVAAQSQYGAVPATP